MNAELRRIEATIDRLVAQRDRYQEALEMASRALQRLESPTRIVLDDDPHKEAIARRQFAAVAKENARRALDGSAA